MFSMMVILNSWFFKLSAVDQGIHKHAIQKTKQIGIFSVLKKKFKWKEKKANAIVSRTTLCTQKK